MLLYCQLRRHPWLVVLLYIHRLQPAFHLAPQAQMKSGFFATTPLPADSPFRESNSLALLGCKVKRKQLAVSSTFDLSGLFNF
jgi:hypothetical protein